MTSKKSKLQKSETSELKQESLPSSNPELGSFAERLRQAIGNRSIRSFAAECGYSDTAIHQYLSAKSEPTRPAILTMARVANVSVGWLLTGEGLMRLPQYGNHAEGAGIVNGDGNEVHVEIHTDHPMRRDADRAMEQLVHYASDPLMSLMVASFSKLSEMQKYDVLKFMAKMKEEKGEG